MQVREGLYQSRASLLQIALFLIVLCSLFAAIWGSGIPGYGLYSDDWNHFFHFYQPRVQQDENQHTSWPGFFLDSRPLRFMEFFFKAMLFRSLGLPAAYAFHLVTLFLASIMFFLVMQQCMPFERVVFTTFLFSFSPMDSTLLWLATTHWRISMLLVLAGIWLLSRERWVPAFLTILAAAEFNEGPLHLLPAALVLHPWKANRKYYIKTTVTIGALLTVFLIWKLTLAPLIIPDAKIAAFLNSGHVSIIKRLGLNYLLGLYILLISVNSQIARSIQEFPVLFSSLVLLTWISVRLGMRFLVRERPSGQTDLQNHRRWITRCLPLLFLLGFMPGLYDWMAYDMGTRSRMNYTSTVFFVFFWEAVVCSMLQFPGFRAVPRKWFRRAGTVLQIVLIAALLTHSFRIRTDYIRSWKQQTNILWELLPEIHLTGPGCMLVFDHLEPRSVAIPVIPAGDQWQVDAISSLLCPPGTQIVHAENLRSISPAGHDEYRIHHLDGISDCRMDRVLLISWVFNHLISQPVDLILYKNNTETP